jgi:phosphoadenosine phosphosulfate reductase
MTLFLMAFSDHWGACPGDVTRSSGRRPSYPPWLRAGDDRHHLRILYRIRPDQCCHDRKILPLRYAVQGHEAWISSIRRDQTANRAGAGLVEWDRSNGLVKLNPLAAWTTGQVWSYVLNYDLPYNPLHDQGYPSIGCWPCTKAVAAGADPRSGRWEGLAKTECGIHLPAAQPA